METISKTRKKYNVDKKITIKYYLREIKNTKNSFGHSRYSLNILLTVDSKVAKFKSKILYDEYLDEKNVKEEERKLLLYREAIEREKEIIKFILKRLKPFDRENFDIKEVNEEYSKPRLFLRTAINDYLYFELFETDDSMMIPMSHFVHPKSFLDYSENLKIQEIGSRFKSKIFSFDMILWILSANNDYGFLDYPPTIVDVLNSGCFKGAIMAETFKALDQNQKDVFMAELKELLNKYIKDFTEK